MGGGANIESAKSLDSINDTSNKTACHSESLSEISYTESNKDTSPFSKIQHDKNSKDAINPYPHSPSGILIESAEFKVYSQNGEDGILDFLIEILELDSISSPYPRAFIEFGVQDYTESNTRYLLFKRHWQGLVLDSSEDYIQYIRNDNMYWRYDLEAQCAFITKDNINTLLQNYLASRHLGNIALLSIDIDGMDYYVWEAILCVQPAIVVIEYNALFGEKCVSVPYRADFDRFKAHFSGLYFGASLSAMITLGKTKGYTFVGCEKSRTNAFFVRDTLASKLHITTLPLSAYGENAHHARQSRDENGKLSFLSGAQRMDSIAHLPLIAL